MTDIGMAADSIALLTSPVISFVNSFMVALYMLVGLRHETVTDSLSRIMGGPLVISGVGFPDVQSFYSVDVSDFVSSSRDLGSSDAFSNA